MKLNLQAIQDKFKNKTVLAVTFEKNQVAIDLVRRENGSSLLLQTTPLSLSLQSLVENPESAGKSMLALLQAARIRERQCVVCLPRHWALFALSDMPDLAEEDLRGYFEIQAERLFPIPTVDLQLGYCPYTLPDGRKQASIAAVPVKYMESVQTMLETAGCKIASISLGIEGCLHQNGSPVPNSLHILPGDNQIDLVITAGGGVVGLRTLSSPLTQPGEEGAVDPQWLYQELRISLGKLPPELSRGIREARFARSIPGFENRVQEIQRNLQRLNIQLVPQTGTTQKHSESHALKAADRFLHRQPIAFEFHVPEETQFQSVLKWFAPKKRRWIVFTPITLLAIPAIAFYLQTREENQLQSDWNQIKQSVTQVDEIQNKLRQYRPWFDPSPNSIRILDVVMSSFPEEGNVWAKSIQIKDNTKMVCEGFAQKQSDISDFMDRLRSHPEIHDLKIQQIRGDKPVQFSFALVWKTKNEE